MTSRGRLTLRHLTSSGSAKSTLPISRNLSYSAARHVPETAITSKGDGSSSASTSTYIPPSTITRVNVPSGAPAPPAGTVTIANRKAKKPRSKNIAEATEDVVNLEKTSSTLSLTEKGKLLEHWHWVPKKVDEERYFQLRGWLRGNAKEAPTWIEYEYDQAKLYRSARARLWVPEEARQHPEGVEAWLQTLLAPLRNREKAAVAAVGKGQELLLHLTTEEEDLRSKVEETRQTIQALQEAVKDADKSWREKGEIASQRLSEELASQIKSREAKVGTLHDSIKAVETKITDAETELANTEERLALDLSFKEAQGYQERVDYAVRPFWRALDEKERRAAYIRVRYECARRLGWRKGYSAGYPTQNAERRARLNALIFELHEYDPRHKKHQEALAKLEAEEEADAWEAWQSMSNSARAAEEKSAWELRDRSRIYIDDSQRSTILRTYSPRWFSKPERVGQLTFLPNDFIRLVRNFTPRGEKSYDAYKATFRVPLNMHKHALRSYLLSIYGCRTTWARSSIHRAPVARTRGLNAKTAQRGGMSTYKKVEVGILEPFIFPEVSAKFKRERLPAEELKANRSRVYFKATGKLRWRGQVRPLPLREDSASASFGDSLVSVRNDLDGWSTTIPKRKDEEVEQRPTLTTYSGIWAKRQSTILKLLSERRKERETYISAQAKLFQARTLELQKEEEEKAKE